MTKNLPEWLYPIFVELSSDRVKHYFLDWIVRIGLQSFQELKSYIYSSHPVGLL